MSSTRDEYGVSSSLIARFDDQERVFARGFAILRNAIAQRAFPAAAVAVTHQGRLVALQGFGSLVHETNLNVPLLGGAKVAPSTLFDLASITKVVATTTIAMMLYQRGLLELDAPIAGTVPEFAARSNDRRRHEVTFRMLLAHSSGLPVYEKLFLKAQTRDELLQAAFAVPLFEVPGTHAEYSDIGFIVLGAALEQLAEEPLDAFCQREIFGPLAMTQTTFNPPSELRQQIPPTADERKGLRKKIIQGEVQDENAFFLGGVAAHAGLFSTAKDVARFAHAMMQCGVDAVTPESNEVEMLAAEGLKDVDERGRIVRHETVALFTRRESTPPGTSRALGWDTPSAPSQSGKYFGPRSYGHLGYTGTSLWIDPDRELSITLLTNRTWPDCKNQAIKQVRPRFHDAIAEAIFGDAKDERAEG